MALTTLDRVKAMLRIPSATTVNDDLLTQLIEDCSSYLESQCHRVFGVSEYTTTFARTHTSGSLALPNYPVIEITSITVDDEALGEDEYVVDASAGVITLTGGAQFYADTCVVVEYTAGYVLPDDDDDDSDAAPLPADLERACDELVAVKYREDPRGPIASLSVGGESMTYTPWASGTPFVLRVISQYKRP
jgi:uncharacterized phiE125 gp8 family phage protein